MPAGRVAMRRVREVLRLGFAGISKHEIARRSGLAASTVRETMARFKASGLDWPLPDSVTDSELEAAAPVVIDRLTGEIRDAWIFVAVLGASNFTYAEATWTQGLADWIGAHTRALAAIDGVPRLIVPDDAKTAVSKAFLYEPAVNRTYTEMAAHYDTAILPTRPRKPRDKAKVEAALLIM